MGDGFQYIDILLFAGIAIFLILKLGRTLGKRTGHETSADDLIQPMSESPNDKGDDKDSVITLPSQRRRQEEADKQYSGENNPLSIGIAEIKKIDQNFDPLNFIDGANMAFEMVLKAFVEADGNSLKMLLAPNVYENFSTAIREREKSNQHIEDTLVGIEKSDILEVSLEEDVANVTIKFITKQVNILYDIDNNIIEGDPHKVIDVIDIWTFSRDMKSNNPNWTLVSTRSQN